MLQRCQINPYYHPECIDDVTILISEGESRMVVEPVCVWVLSYLATSSSSVSLKELVEQKPKDVNPFDITRAIHVLEKREFIIAPGAETAWGDESDDNSNVSSNVSGNVSSLGHGNRSSKNLDDSINRSQLPHIFKYQTTQQTSSGWSVGISIIGKADSTSVESLLLSNQYQINTSKNDFHIYVTNDLARGDFIEIAQVHRDNGIPWVAIENTGKTVLMSPLFHSRLGSCWECMQFRMKKNQPINNYLARHITCDVADLRPNLINAKASQASAEFILQVVQKYLTYSTSVDGDVDDFTLLREYSVEDNSLQDHYVVNRENCQSCNGQKKDLEKASDQTCSSAEGLNEKQAIHLDLSEQPCVNLSGGYRTVSAAHTIKKYSHLVSALVGVVPKLEPYHQQRNIPVVNYSSGRNVAMQSHSRFWLNQHLRSGNGGKGKEEAQAKAGALCEAIERYCMVYHDDVERFASSMSSLQQSFSPQQEQESKNTCAEVVYPNACMNFSEAQYQYREKLNHDIQQFYSLIPRYLEPDEITDWTPVFNVSKNHFAYFPTALCYAQVPHNDEMEMIAFPDSNGCAAGNTLEEAILQGLFELIERDAAAIWWYNKISRESVNIQSFNNEYLNSVCDYYKTMGRSLHVLNITTDIGVPVFVAISGCQNAEKEKIIYAFGAHVDASVAIERCIIELNQLLPIVLADGYLVQDKNLVEWFDTATFEDETYLMPHRHLTQLTSECFPRFDAPSVGGALKQVLEQLHKQDLTIYCLDLTQKDIGLPVVRMLVPGLRHYWRRLGPGRLYTVPVKMGWLKEERAEQELNAISIVI